MQRLRITFARGGAARYLAHLEQMRMWERVLRRAGWRVAHSHGFNPHPRLSFASALPVGVASEGELLEVYLEEPRPLEGALSDLSAQMPDGFRVLSIEDVPVDAPPIQRELVAAEYLVICPAPPDVDLAERAGRLLAAATLPRERLKEGVARSYDLRPMIRSLAVEGAYESHVALRMVLRTDAAGAGRADEVLRALDLDPAECTITRTRLFLSPKAAPPPAQLPA